MTSSPPSSTVSIDRVVFAPPDHVTDSNWNPDFIPAAYVVTTHNPVSSGSSSPSNGVLGVTALLGDLSSRLLVQVGSNGPAGVETETNSDGGNVDELAFVRTRSIHVRGPVMIDSEEPETVLAETQADATGPPPVLPSSTAVITNYTARPDWQLLSFETFDFSADGWSHKSRQRCGESEDHFLGGYCHFGNTTVSKKYVKLPVHSVVRLQARVHFFDRWTGEYLIAKVDDLPVWTRHHKHCTSIMSWLCRGINVCGDGHYADRMSESLDVTFQHSARTLTVSFVATVTVPPCLASWAIDDVAIFVL